MESQSLNKSKANVWLQSSWRMHMSSFFRNWLVVFTPVTRYLVCSLKHFSEWEKNRWAWGSLGSFSDMFLIRIRSSLKVKGFH